MKTTFSSYEAVNSLEELVVGGDEKQKRMRLDPHIPDLVAVAPGLEFATVPAYKNGEIILQDKASCFPAYLLLGEDWGSGGDLMDGCAAPGNKTTHMASLLCKPGRKRPSSHIFSMDASRVRAKTLQKMVSTAGADNLVTVLQGQDFLALDPEDPRFKDVTGLLLDPSCSGSGIIGRDDIPELILPTSGKATPSASSTKKNGQNQNKKRKRNEASAPNEPEETPSATAENDLPTADINQERLTKLSNLQTLIVTHALSFTSATRITYSTCSIHLLENESVVARILDSEVAKRRGWRVLRRDEQPEGLRKWKHRGVRSEKASDGIEECSVDLAEEDLEGCLRCWPGDEEGTGGFFVVGFVRDGDVDEQMSSGSRGEDHEDIGEEEEEEGEDEWEGFSD